MAPQRREFAKLLRKQQTKAEDILWERLRGSRSHDAIPGLRPGDRRQVPFDRFVVDFYRHAATLVVELDGKQHVRGLRRRADESPGDARRQRHSFLEWGGRGRPRIRAHADPRGAPGPLRLKRGPLTPGPSPMGEGGASRRLRLAGGDRDRGRPRPPPRPQPRTGKNRAPPSRTGKGPGEGAGRRKGAQNKKLDKIRIFGYQYSNGRNRAV